jgi:gas vesicle protein
MNRFLSFISGGVMGFLVGSTLGLLLTPASGNELRTKIQEQSKRIQHEVKTAADKRRSELENQLSTLRQP